MKSDETRYAAKEGELNETDCYADRKTVGRINRKSGEIFLIDNENFAVRYDGEDKPLLPCNLPGPLQKAGTKIIFSGVVKETKLEELWAGEPFVLTMVEEK